MLVNRTIVEYYEAYFHPFDSFTPDERDGLRQKLLVAAKMENDYDRYAEKMDDIEEQISSPEPPAQIETRPRASLGGTEAETDTPVPRLPRRGA